MLQLRESSETQTPAARHTAGERCARFEAAAGIQSPSPQPPPPNARPAGRSVQANAVIHGLLGTDFYHWSFDSSHLLLVFSYLPFRALPDSVTVFEPSGQFALFSGWGWGGVGWEPLLQFSPLPHAWCLVHTDA